MNYKQLIGFATLFIGLSATTSGILFKLMNWHGGIRMLYGGIVILFCSAVILYTSRRKTIPQNKKE